MVLDAVSNFVRGNTDAEVGTEDTTVSVDDASIFPDPETDGEFNVVIWDANNFPRPDQDGDVEILRVTERDTTDDELTVTRAQEMTSEASHPEGSAIHLSPTAKMFSDIESTFGDFWDAGTQELTADVNNTNTTTTALEAEGVSTELIGNTRHYAGSYDGEDSDERLNNALDAADSGDVIYLEPGGTYTAERTISKRVRIVGGTVSTFENDTSVESEWTLSGRGVSLQNMRMGGGATVTADSDLIQISNFAGSGNTELVVSDDRCVIGLVSADLSITFESGTDNGEIGIVDGTATITDNGNNSILS